MKRTATLTGRPPVTFDDKKFPLVASASDKEHDGQVECQANRTSTWWIKVRQNSTGNAIVYAGYDYSTNWQNARSYQARRGVMVPDATSQEICDAINSVCADIATAEHNGDDAARWRTIAAECVADMPAEELA